MRLLIGDHIYVSDYRDHRVEILIKTFHKSFGENDEKGEKIFGFKLSPDTLLVMVRTLLSLKNIA